jgi:hypothetical protein
LRPHIIDISTSYDRAQSSCAVHRNHARNYPYRQSSFHRSIIQYQPRTRNASVRSTLQCAEESPYTISTIRPIIKRYKYDAKCIKKVNTYKRLIESYSKFKYSPYLGNSLSSQLIVDNRKSKDGVMEHA